MYDEKDIAFVLFGEGWGGYFVWDLEENPFIRDLLAGQHWVVGNVTFRHRPKDDDDEYIDVIIVTVEIDATIKYEGQCLGLFEDLHIYIHPVVPDAPDGQPGSAPGQYPFKYEFNNNEFEPGTQFFTIDIPLVEGVEYNWMDETEFYIALHANVCPVDCDP